MTAQRGLTLIEMLASAALLTLLATAAVPVLRSAHAAQQEPQAFDLVELSRLADLAVADAASLADGETITIGWDELDDDVTDRPPVAVRIVTAGEHGAWVAFTCDRLHVFRWIHRESEQ